MNYIANIGSILKTMKWDRRDKDALVQLWTSASMSGPLQTRGRLSFALLLDNANLPDAFKAEMADPWLPGAEDNARLLFDWAVGKGINPQDPQYSTLASILLPSLPKMGVADASLCAALIVKYNLIVGREKAEHFSTRFQVPRVSVNDGISDYGPEFDWVGPETEDGLQLQGLFSDTASEFDIGYLKRITQAAAAVCRIEIAGKSEGTGFLVSPNLIVTSFHLFGSDISTLERSLSKTIVRFGALTNYDATEDTGQSVGIEAKPVAFSQVDEFDYVLLRALPDIKLLTGLSHLPLQNSNPGKGDAMCVLHHPRGDSMKVCFARNGVVSIGGNGKLQYAAKTSGGSSGSPCLNDAFKVVAIHRAARSKVWGIAGEGIGTAAIFEDVNRFI